MVVVVGTPVASFVLTLDSAVPKAFAPPPSVKVAKRNRPEGMSGEHVWKQILEIAVDESVTEEGEA